MEISLDESTGSATINIAASLDANGVEQLIHELSNLRAQMSPPVARTVRQAMEEDAAVIEIEQPAAQFGRTHTGALRIWLRHSGLGWLAFLLPPADVEGLANLIGKKPAHSGASHH